MHGVSARATNGYRLVLDQCAQCGGIWCDRWELYPLDAAEAERLDAVDTDLLAVPPPAPDRPGRCPRCTCALRPFRDPLLPDDAVIERCPVCDGMWCKRGALRRAKHKARSRLATADVDKLARLLAHTDPPPAPTITNLDAATYAADPDPAPAPDEWREWLYRAAPWLAAFTLLKLLLR